jgi:hypothetical protein
MKHAMDHPTVGPVGLIFGWMLGFIAFISVEKVPIILSSIASLMAIVNYYYQIKKNKNGNPKL